MASIDAAISGSPRSAIESCSSMKANSAFQINVAVLTDRQFIPYDYVVCRNYPYGVKMLHIQAHFRPGQRVLSA